jgi:hypothetical protein
MPLALRIDVDKPYGNHSFIRKLASKFFEETALPSPNFGYLDHLRTFLDILKIHNIVATFYFRLCSLPSHSLLKEMVLSGHKIGWHLENSKTYETFFQELKVFKKKTGIIPHSFTKHGSGTKKLGRYHYPTYEVEKYIEWSKISEIPFIFGNDAFSPRQQSEQNFFPACFWVEKPYRNKQFNEINSVISKAQTETIPILTHPENVVRDDECLQDLLEIFEKARLNNIPWVLL